MATIERLTRRPDFLAAAEGRRFHTDRLTAQGRLRGEGAAPGLRVGLTVTKRVGCAPERNRIKRRLRAALSHLAAELPPGLAALPADIVLIARRPALSAAFAALGDDLRRAIPLVTRPGGGRRGPRPPGGGRSPPTPARRGEAPAAESGSAEPRPSATSNACCGVPDGQ